MSVVNASSRSNIETYLKNSIDSWVKEFFLDVPLITISFSEAFFNTKCNDNSNSLFELGDGCILIDDCQNMFIKLATKSVAIDRSLDVSADLIFWQEIAGMMQKSLFKIFGFKDNDLKPNHLEGVNQFSSSVDISLQFDAITLKMSMNYELLKQLKLLKPSEALKGNQERLVSLSTGVANEKVQVKAKLRGASIQLNDFLELKTGDVLKLKHAVDECLILETSDNRLEVNAFLVKSGSSKAILLTK